MRRALTFSLLFFSSQTMSIPALAQQRVSPQHMYHRAWVKVPIIGAGTSADPKRPLYTPKPGEKSAIIGYSLVLSDDKQFALVEFVTRDRAGLQQLMSDKRPDVSFFEKGKDSKEVVEKEFRKVKAAFTLDELKGARP